MDAIRIRISFHFDLNAFIFTSHLGASCGSTRWKINEKKEKIEEEEEEETIPTTTARERRGREKFQSEIPRHGPARFHCSTRSVGGGGRRH